MADKTKRVIGKGDSRYWLQPGKLLTDARSPHLSCRIQARGRRTSFPLNTSNKEAAAQKAAGIYTDVIALGLEGALAKHKPETMTRPKFATIGALIREVGSTAGFKAITFATYARCLRHLVAEIEEVGDQPKLDEHGKPLKDRRGRIIYQSRRHSAGNRAWIAAVDALPLSTLSAVAIQKWKVGYIDRAGNAPDARKRAENTVASILRNARSLFAEKALEHSRSCLILPQPLPFVGVQLPKKSSTAYQSKIDAATLIESARAELEREPFKIFCLGLICGLRKREIDLLMWAQVDFAKAVVRIERTEFFAPKSEDSVGEVDLDPALIVLLRSWKEKKTGVFVIESTRPVRLEVGRTTYRCQPYFKTLYAWLRKHGVTARKPLHELRKELGAILASTQGIFAAQSVLRHAQISTTAAYYTDKKKRITAGLGMLLNPKPE